MTGTGPVPADLRRDRFGGAPDPAQAGRGGAIGREERRTMGPRETLAYAAVAIAIAAALVAWAVADSARTAAKVDAWAPAWAAAAEREVDPEWGI